MVPWSTQVLNRMVHANARGRAITDTATAAGDNGVSSLEQLAVTAAAVLSRHNFL